VERKEKVLISSTCVLGILGVCYGMVNKNHPVFIAGLVFVVGGYLMIRKKLKAHLREKYPSEDDQKNTHEN
jgi:hypothetical protein